MYSERSSNPPTLRKKYPNLPDADYKSVWLEEKNFKAIKRLNDPRFGEISIVKNSHNNEVLFCKEKLASSKQEATEDILNLKARLKLNQPNLLKLKNYASEIKKELCSTHYITRAYFEFPRSDLLKEATDKKKEGSDFNDQELLDLTRQALTGLDSVHQRKVAHGDIRPQYLGHDWNSGRYMLLDRLKDQSVVEKCQTNRLVANEEIFMSPELYASLKGKEKNKVFNRQKNDLYALGMSILQLGTGESVKRIYNKDGSINQANLSESIGKFDQKYGYNAQLSNTVKSLLEQDERKRVSANTLINDLSQQQQPVQVQQPQQQESALFFDHQENTVNSQQKMEQTQPNTFVETPQNRTVNQMTANIPSNRDGFEGTNKYMVPLNQAPQPMVQSYVQSIPQPTVQSYVQSTPQYVYHQQEPRYVQSYVVQPQQHYTRTVQSHPRNYRFEDATQTVVSDSQGRVIRRSFRNEDERKVEAKVESTKKITKRYVMREDGTMVELDPNANLGTEEIKKHFDVNHNDHVVKND